jgi:bacterioferritin-associated ferredoxin
MELCDPQNLVLQCSTEATRPLCHCLNISEGEVREAIAENSLQTVRGVAKVCGAGGGCTACHRHIKRLLNEQIVQGRMQQMSEVFATQH